MKILPIVAACLITPVAVLAQTLNQDATTAPGAADLSQPTITLTPPTARDLSWAQVLTAIGAPGGGAATPEDALNTANIAKSFYTEYPQDTNATEARKFEAIFLIHAADGSDPSTQARMLAVVRDFRADIAVPAFQRAIVAGTYEFLTARKRIKTLADFDREHEAVARGLINEFPDQPQGYISLLTEATRRDDHAIARSMALEVAESSSAPDEARMPARRFMTRLDLVGQPVEKMFGSVPLGPTGKAGWPSNRPGLIYVWATWSPESVALGEKLAGKEFAAINVVGVCLDADPTGAVTAATTHKLPGRLIYRAKGGNDMLPEQLGVDQVPLLYLVDAQGRITDVRGLKDLDAKLASLGR